MKGTISPSNVLGGTLVPIRRPRRDILELSMKDFSSVLEENRDQTRGARYWSICVPVEREGGDADCAIPLRVSGFTHLTAFRITGAFLLGKARRKYSPC